MTFLWKQKDMIALNSVFGPRSMLQENLSYRIEFLSRLLLVTFMGTGSHKNLKSDLGFNRPQRMSMTSSVCQDGDHALVVNCFMSFYCQTDLLFH